MITATITEAGYIAIPKDILDCLHVHAGDLLEIEMDAQRVLKIRPRTLSPKEVSGMLASRPHRNAPEGDLDSALEEAFRRGDI